MAAPRRSKLLEFSSVNVPELPVLRVDLSLPPAERWREVAAYFMKSKERRGPLRRVLRGFEQAAEMDPQSTASICEHYKSAIVSLGEQEQWEELVGYAKCIRTTVRALVLAQLEPDLAAGCTTAIVRLHSNRCWMVRTLDWIAEMDLSPLAFHARFTNGDRCIADAATFAGLVGCMTAQQRVGRFAVALNYRLRPQFAGTPAAHGRVARRAAMRLLEQESDRRQEEAAESLAEGCWPLCAFVRRLCLRCADYAEAVGESATARVAAPCYIVVCGDSTAAVIPRAPSDQPAPPPEGGAADGWARLVQTNHDVVPHPVMTGAKRPASPPPRPRPRRRRTSFVADSAERLSVMLHRVDEWSPRAGRALDRAGAGPAVEKGLLRRLYRRLLCGAPISADGTALGVVACPSLGVFDAVDGRALTAAPAP